MASRSLGSLTLDLVAKVGGFTGPIDKAARDLDRQTQGMKKNLDGFATSLKTIGAGIAGFLSGAAIAGFTGLAVGIKKTVDSMDELSKSAQKIGITTEELSKLSYAGELADVSLETLTSSLGKLTKAQAAALDESSKTAEVFEALGIAVKNADGSLRSSTGVLGDFAQRFKELGGSPEAIAAGFQIFGRSFQELIPLLKDGRDGIEAAGNELEQFGGVITTQAGQAAEDFNDNLTRLKTQFGAIFIQIAEQLLPSLVELSKDLARVTKDGSLAANATVVFSTAMKVAVGAIDFYNGAVNRSSVAMEAFIGLAKTSAVIGAQVLSLGLADGTITGAIRGYIGTLKDADAKLKSIGKMEDAPSFFDVGSTVSSTEKTTAEAQAEASAKAMEERLRKLRLALEGGAKAKKDNTKATKEQTEAEKLFKEQILEINDLIDEISRDTQSDLFFNRQDRQEEQQQFLADLEFESQLLGKTAEEQEVLNNLRYAGAYANSDYGKSIIATTEAIQAQRKATEEQIAIMDTFRMGFEDAFVDVISGAKSFKDAFLDMVDSIIASLTRLIAQNLIEQAFGQTGSTGTGSSGGWIQAFASLFGGGRASGGGVSSNRFYRVNENDPEMLTVGNRDYLMMGSQGGNVTPSHALGSQNVSFTYINPQMNDMRSESQRRQEAAINLSVASRRNS